MLRRKTSKDMVVLSYSFMCGLGNDARVGESGLLTD
jgi:hypothetical protein